MGIVKPLKRPFNKQYKGGTTGERARGAEEADGDGGRRPWAGVRKLRLNNQVGKITDSSSVGINWMRRGQSDRTGNDTRGNGGSGSGRGWHSGGDTAITCSQCECAISLAIVCGRLPGCPAHVAQRGAGASVHIESAFGVVLATAATIEVTVGSRRPWA